MDQIYAARYLVSISSPPIENGALLVRDGRIRAAGRREAVLRESPKTRIRDFGDAVLLPPLVNAHTHLELSLFPEWSRDLDETGTPSSFVEWILQVIRVKRRTAPERYRDAVAEGLRLCFAAGTGMIGDVLSTFSARHAYEGTPMRGRLFLEALGRDPDRIRGVLREIARVSGEGRAGRMEFGIAPHSPYTLSSRCLREVFGFLNRRGTPATIHLGESAEETEFLMHAGGPIAETLYPHVGWESDIPAPASRSPVAYLHEHKGLESGTLLVHGVHVGEEDADVLAGFGCPVVLCPRSNERLGVGLPPLEMYRRKGVPLALGTDSLASCNTLSVWDEIAFARARLPGADPSFLLEAATRGGAKALRMEDRAGTLSSGAPADFQVLRTAFPPSLHELEECLCAPGINFEVSALFLDGLERTVSPEISDASARNDMV